MSELYEWWNAHYITAAQTAFPVVTAGHDLAVGWKLTHTDGTTHGGYYWPLVNGDHDLPVLHQASAWTPNNGASCPSKPGDGLCLIPQGQPVSEATSGGCRFASAIGHVLVYPADLAKGVAHKKRAPWVIDVDCFRPVDALALLARYASGAYLHGANLSGADLTGADLHRAYLTGANLYGANLTGADLTGADLHRAYLSGANLHRADLTGANLYGANLYGANLYGANLSGANLYGANLYGANLHRANHNQGTLWPVGFDFKAATA